jgi:pentapeptide repeat protein
MMKKKNILWYTRHHGAIIGPFTGSVITNDIIIGRLTMSDEVSPDQKNWQIILSVPELHPYNATNDLDKAKRHLDERNGFDRRQQNASDVHAVKRRIKERRSDEDKFDIYRRQLRTKLMLKFRQQKPFLFWPLVTTFIVLTIIVLLALIFPQKLPISLADCSAPAASEVNWSNCLKPKLDLQNKDLTNSQLRNSQLIGSNFMNTNFIGSDLAYADLRFTDLNHSQLQNTILLGSNLRNADLSYADLTNADLSYTDLTNANLGGSKLNNARFGNAIWIDGQLCAPQSIGQCITVDSQDP